MQTRHVIPSHDPLVRYVNVTINNPTDEVNRCAEFDVTYDRNIIDKASDHMVGVVNATLPLQDLPSFIFPIQPGQSNPNLSTLQVGISKNIPQVYLDAGNTLPTVDHTLTNLIWVPQELGLSAPDQTNTTVQKISPYHFGYSFEHFVNVVNTAVHTAWNAEGSPGIQPEFSYDDTDHTFSWKLADSFIDDTTANTWSVCWNKDFDVLVNNFNSIENTLSDGSKQYILEDVKSRKTNTVSANLIATQDFPTIDAFNGVERLLILTQAIPIASDYFPSQYLQEQSGGLSNTERILLDVPLQGSTGDFRYNPDLYQLNDLQSTLPITRIGLKLKWADSLNNFYDIAVNQQDNITVKLGFFSKKLPYI